MNGTTPHLPTRATSVRMSKQRTKDTQPELMLRRSLRRLRLGYRVQARPLPGVRIQPDVLFLRARVAVFVDGCFWHACPDHASWPASNAEFWRSKIIGNVDRDRATDALLKGSGWTVVRMWEHEDPETVARAIRALVRGARQ